MRTERFIRATALVLLAALQSTAPMPAAANGQTRQVEQSLQPAASRDRLSSNDQQILVTGSRSTDAAIDSFVSTLLAETGNGRVAQWANRICLNVEGGSADRNHYFAARIAEIAVQLGIQVVTDRKCEPSAYIVFTAEPDLLLDQLRERRPAFFGSIPDSRLESLRSSEAPVRWLSHADIRGAHGEAPASFHTAPIPNLATGPERPVPSMRTTPSRIVNGSRMDLQTMLVLVDASKIAGISNGSLSDYLTMVVLGNLRPDHGDVGQPSILSLFSSASAPGEVITSELTEWDVAYLASLYQGNWNMMAEQRTRRIRASMARNLGGRPHEDGSPQ